MLELRGKARRSSDKSLNEAQRPSSIASGKAADVSSVNWRVSAGEPCETPTTRAVLLRQPIEIRKGESARGAGALQKDQQPRLASSWRDAEWWRCLSDGEHDVSPRC